MSSDTLRIHVPAKINLFLHIVGRRPNGYHNLQSIFAPISWFDELTVTRTTDGRITRHGGPDDVSEHDDLSIRAAHALKPWAAPTAGARIELKKNIPSGAGMGGGSADAAYVLLALKSLWALDISDQALADIGLSLGADVPFFLCGRAAFVEGIGEQITPIELPPKHLVVVKPPASLPTPTIFKHPELTRDKEHVTISVFGFASSLAWQQSQRFGNSLENVAKLLCEEVSLASELLTVACSKADVDPWFVRMTGSGSAVFAVVDNSHDAQQVQHQVQELLKSDSSRYAGKWLVHTCTTLPDTSLAQQSVRV